MVHWTHSAEFSPSGRSVDSTHKSLIDTGKPENKASEKMEEEGMDRNIRLNLAYGSNLDIEKMAKRCPTAAIHGRGVLHGYRLLFKGEKGNAYATIEPSEGREVPVLLWDLNPEDEEALDIYEEYPLMYYKENLLVRSVEGGYLTAMAYIMSENTGGDIALNLPGDEYLEDIRKGYEDNGFDFGIIEEALRRSAEAVSDKDALQNVR